ncbi:TolC family protein [Undibacterium sp. Ren11W]|uniref:TolC family protein n=1 Tax=Undibacterium sp. Ren11W TaxID=3413045 RepID=UPI003BEF5982
MTICLTSKKTWIFGLLCSFAMANLSAAGEMSGIEGALRATVKLNPTLKAKLSEVTASGFDGDVARAQRFPSLSGQWAANDDHTRPGSVRLRQPLWAFGRIDSSINFADASLTANQADYIQLMRQVMDLTVTSYAHVQGSKARLQIAEDNLQSLTKLYQQIQRRQRGELASVADVRLALARMLQAQSQKDRYLTELDVAMEDLLSLTLVPVDAKPAIPATLLQLPVAADLAPLAQEQSAVVQLKLQRIKLAQALVARELTASMPTVYLQGDHVFNQAFVTDKARVSIVLEASLDGMGFSTIGRTRAADARVQASTDDLNAARNEIRRTVTGLLSNLQLQKNLEKSQAESVTEVNAILDSYQRQYESGFKSWLDVLNMQRELTEQRLLQVQASNDGQVSALKLKVLIGGLDYVIDQPER